MVNFLVQDKEAPSSETPELLGFLRVEFTSKFKIRRAWCNTSPTCKYILVEYDNGRLYRVYKPNSTVNQSGKQTITGLFFFSSYESVIDYIRSNNLPTELYHTYCVRRLSPNRYDLTDYKIRYNRVEETAYITLPIQDKEVQETSLKVGDTINLLLQDQTTKSNHRIALHKILGKEHNYCAIRLTPTATQYFISHYNLDIYPLLATRHISLEIEKVPLSDMLRVKRYAHVKLAKPALLESLFREDIFLESLLGQIGYRDIENVEIRFLSDGRNRPDLKFKAIKETEAVQVIGECKACNKKYSHQIVKAAAIQLLYYKSCLKTVKAQEGLLIVTGTPTKPDWESLSTRIKKFAKKSSSKASFYSKKILIHSNIQLHHFQDWFENHVELITGPMMRQAIKNLEAPNKPQMGTNILDFIEK